jgi:hypothetical protein
MGDTMRPTVSDFRRKTYLQILNEFGFESEYTRHFGLNRTISVAKTSYGWLIQTCYTDEFQVTLIETLVTYNGRKAFLCNRERAGTDPWRLSSDDRNARFPVGTIVNLGQTVKVEA